MVYIRSDSFLLAIWFLSRFTEGFQCFASLPSSFTFDDSYQYQASGYCNQQCAGKGYKYFALKNRSDCYCGNENPVNSESPSNGCDGPCLGYPSEMCGGTNAFSVYAIPANGGSAVEVSSSLSVSSASTTSSTSSTSSSSSTSTSTSTSTSSSSSSSSTPSTTTITPTSSSSPISHTTESVVYITNVQTDGGSTVYVTSTITTSKQGMPTASTETNQTDKNGSNKKKVNVGAIVGGVVGGVAGALLIAAAVLLILRHINKKREQERMEKEYQEAIKPVEYGDKSLHHGSSSTSLNNLPSSGSFEDTTRVMSHTNPFDDSRRISNGSILHGPNTANTKILTVVNPDED
ncbi:hypothetical protein HG537_0D04990 [Torulaspora globosa]|uniref:WSC domain-containing protein n=1 Tax=Torulaspora globosa TaxID=48254 RepID=A0A7H9HT53_9SACH|nr:hypothetical protein HG537_0D04990 [Torulaspora sp. CBS 2947]